MKRSIEIDDTLDEIIGSACEDVKNELLSYLEENPDTYKLPCISNDLDYSGAIHGIIDSATPIYTAEIDGLHYLYGDDFEESYRNAGIGDGSEENHKAVAIYCYIEEKVNEWYRLNADDVFEEWSEAQDKKEKEEAKKEQEAEEKREKMLEPKEV